LCAIKDGSQDRTRVAFGLSLELEEPLNAASGLAQLSRVICCRTYEELVWKKTQKTGSKIISFFSSRFTLAL
jgi:hypothetical protein